MTQPDLPDVSIIIVSWNSRKVLETCLASIRRHTKQVSYEILVVDNGSTDGTPELVRTNFPEVRLFLPGTNLGFARANNLALRESRGRHILFLNPDTELRSDVLSHFCRKMDRDAGLGLLGCLLLWPDGVPQYTCAATYPAPWNTLCEGFFLHRLARRFPTLGFLSSRSLEHWDHRSAREVDCLSGAFLFCRGSVARQLGGFDEGYFMYGEDLDFCRRVRLLGYRIEFDPTHTVIHYGGASAALRPDFRPRREQFRANLQFVSKHFGSGRARLFRWACLTGTLFRLVLSGIGSLVARSRRDFWTGQWRLNMLLLQEYLSHSPKARRESSQT